MIARHTSSSSSSSSGNGKPPLVERALTNLGSAGSVLGSHTTIKARQK